MAVIFFSSFYRYYYCIFIRIFISRRVGYARARLRARDSRDKICDDATSDGKPRASQNVRLCRRKYSREALTKRKTPQNEGRSGGSPRNTVLPFLIGVKEFGLPTQKKNVLIIHINIKIRKTQCWTTKYMQCCHYEFA